MGIFRKDSKDQTATLEPEPDCPHVALSARWDEIEDMGKEDRASSYVCQSCGDVFSPAEVQRLRESEAERIGAN